MNMQKTFIRINVIATNAKAPPTYPYEHHQRYICEQSVLKLFASTRTMFISVKNALLFWYSALPNLHTCPFLGFCYGILHCNILRFQRSYLAIVNCWDVLKKDSYLSLVVRKPAFCICENKDADQLRGNCEADQRLCFRYSDSTIPLLPISVISSL